MNTDEAVRITCEIGLKIDKGLSEAEKHLRTWRTMPNGGHDPALMSSLQEPDLARGLMPQVLPGDIPPDGGNAEGATNTCPSKT